jgi:hypothetical protein
MNTIKRSLFLTAVFAFVASAFIPAQAGTGNINLGITNAVFAGSATVTAFGAVAADVKHQDLVTIVYRGSAVTTNASTNTLYFARVDATGNIETTPRFSMAVPLATAGANGTLVTNNFVAMQVFDRSTIGAATSLVLVSNVTVNTGGYTTNPVVTVELKDTR